MEVPGAGAAVGRMIKPTSGAFDGEMNLARLGPGRVEKPCPAGILAPGGLIGGTSARPPG